MTDTAREAAHRRATPDDGTLTFTLDGRAVTANKGELLIAAAERAGTYIPRFCYHPRMEPVGMCRMCLVEVEGPRGATLQPACFIEVAEGMVVDTTSEKVKKAQDGVLEFLLANHPLDCPVCDKGGECPLQDQTLAYGPGESRFIEEKRHFEKPIAISDLVLLDRERCIQCARCTRFAAEVAGEAQIDFAGRGEAVEVATFPTEPFSSYFSGNTVQICPVGALTATPYRFTARPWDLDQVESTCTACSVGCRVAVQSSQNRLTRLLGIDSEPVNHGWLCDKGRFAFESVNGDEVDAGPLPSEVADEAVDVAPGHRVPGRQPRREPRPVPRRGPRDGPLRARPPGRAARPQGGRAGPGQLGRGPGRRGGRAIRAAKDAGGAGAVAADRRGPPDQRVRLRLGQAGQGRHRHRLGRRPAGRRPARRARAGPAPGHHRRGLRRAGARHAGRRPARGAAGPLPAPARGRGRRRHRSWSRSRPPRPRSRALAAATLRIRPGDAPLDGPGAHRRRRRGDARWARTPRARP